MFPKLTIHMKKILGASYELWSIFYIHQAYYYEITRVVMIHLVGHSITIFVFFVGGRFILCMKFFVIVMSQPTWRGKRNVSLDRQHISKMYSTKSIFQC